MANTTVMMIMLMTLTLLQTRMLLLLMMMMDATAALYCSIVCFVLFCRNLRYASILYCTVLYCIVLYCMLHCILHCILCVVVLCCVVLCRSLFHDRVLRFCTDSHLFDFLQLYIVHYGLGSRASLLMRPALSVGSALPCVRPPHPSQPMPQQCHHYHQQQQQQQKEEEEEQHKRNARQGREEEMTIAELLFSARLCIHQGRLYQAAICTAAALVPPEGGPLYPPSASCDQHSTTAANLAAASALAAAEHSVPWTMPSSGAARDYTGGDVEARATPQTAQTAQTAQTPGYPAVSVPLSVDWLFAEQRHLMALGTLMYLDPGARSGGAEATSRRRPRSPLLKHVQKHQVGVWCVVL